MNRDVGARPAMMACAALLLAACGSDEASNGAPSAAERGETGASASAAPEWRFVDTPQGATVALASDSGVEMRLTCRGAARELLVNVPSFRPVGSEERMTFGQGGTVETLVADPSGDKDLGGVSATGPVPDNLRELVSGEVAANYGSQNSGPHPALPPDMVAKFVNACGSTGGDRSPERNGDDAPAPSAENASACLTGRDGRRLPANRIHAVGTEPFWAANVQGRCVTYSHPEDQDGTRVWTEFSGSAERGTWSGYLNNQRFVMRTRPQAGCSDGMSDKRYPIAVTLAVNGEQRQGCAEYR